MTHELIFKVADPEELALALALRSTVYIEDLGNLPEDGLDNAAHHLIARADDGPVVAAVRILGPDLRPFDFEVLCDVRSLLLDSRRPALIGRFCVRRDYRTARRSTFIHVGLLRLAVEFGIAHDFTDYFLCTFSWLLRFYRGARFEPVGVDFEHPDWGRLWIMRLDLTTISQGAPLGPHPTRPGPSEQISENSGSGHEA